MKLRILDAGSTPAASTIQTTERKGDRRKIERRAAKRGVTVRVGDKVGEKTDDPKRIRHGRNQ